MMVRRGWIPGINVVDPCHIPTILGCFYHQWWHAGIVFSIGLPHHLISDWWIPWHYHPVNWRLKVASEFPRFANRSVQSIHRIAISSGKNEWMKGDFAGTPLIWRGTPCIPVNVVKSISRCLHWTCEEIAEKTEVLMQKENQLSAPWTAWRHGQLANSLHHGLDDVQNYSYIHRFEYHINC